MTKILFLASNPIENSPLSLDEESREIGLALRLAKHGSSFDFKQQWAVRVTDLQDLLQYHEPDVVHFSGHGTESKEILLLDDSGEVHPVSADALDQMFSLYRDHLRCVVLNACYTAVQGQAIAKNIDCVIGMSKELGDEAAISFAKAFYLALANGHDIQLCP